MVSAMLEAGCDKLKCQDGNTCYSNTIELSYRVGAQRYYLSDVLVLLAIGRKSQIPLTLFQSMT